VYRRSRELDNHQLPHAARADLLRRPGSSEEAAQSYARALDLSGPQEERLIAADALNHHKVAAADIVGRFTMLNKEA